MAFALFLTAITLLTVVYGVSAVRVKARYPKYRMRRLSQ